jgi:hypothetical protein
MIPRNNSATAGYAPRGDLGSEDYAEQTAKPTMDAIDHMPLGYRELVNELGYIPVYRAWRRGLSESAILAAAKDGLLS